jgi:hypothetical protein
MKDGQNQAVPIYQQSTGFREAEVCKQSIGMNIIPVK